MIMCWPNRQALLAVVHSLPFQSNFKCRGRFQKCCELCELSIVSLKSAKIHVSKFINDYFVTVAPQRKYIVNI